MAGRWLRRIAAGLALGGWIAAAAPVVADDRVRVFAAASLADAMDAAIMRYEARSGSAVVASYASSATSARQLARGAPGAVFVSANRAWMNWLAGRVRLAQRAVLLGNRLVVVAAPRSGVATLDPERPGAFADALGANDRLALGDPNHVPAGIYARQALRSLGHWPQVRDRLAPTADVRRALALVARGEAPLGVVYRTDALASDRVRTLATLPADSHDPIAYTVATVRPPVSADARAFREWLGGSEAAGIFREHGFSLPAAP